MITVNSSILQRLSRLALGITAFCTLLDSAYSEQWIRHELSRDFNSEGGTCADIDNDGNVDLIAGPIVYYGPDFKVQSTMYDAKPFSINGYSGNFLSYAYDVNADGLTDIVYFDFPGAQTWYLQNPGKNVRDLSKWKEHAVFDVTDNESPMLTDITGDGKPEIICCSGGCFGYAEIGADPAYKWAFTPVSENGGYQRFTHGIGVGDVNDDGKLDMMAAHGWWENPGVKSGEPSKGPWTFHPFQFAGSSAQMYAVDFDGDGQNEVVSSQQAHGYGLKIFDKVADKSTGKWSWNAQEIMTDKAETSPTGLSISQLHAVEVADMNGDKIPDIVTGKRFWAHQGHDPGENEPTYLVWFESVRTPGNSVRFVPHMIDDDSGVGTEITVFDVNKDGKLDVFSASKRGVHLFIQTDDDNPQGNHKLAAAQAKQFSAPVTATVEIKDTIGGFRPADENGDALNLNFETGTLKDWRGSGAAFFKQPVKGNLVTARRNDMKSNQEGDYWIGTFEICQDIAEGKLESRPFKLTKPWASFLIGGGSSQKSKVQLVELGSGEVLASQTGADTETMKRAVHDLSKFLNKDVFIRLVDTGAEGWGHLNFDDFRLHDSEPKLSADEKISKLDVLSYEKLDPKDVAKAMTLPEDFSVQVMAAEPDVRQPVAMTIDEKGRMWVIEAFEYPFRAQGDTGKDRIIILEDTNKDGTLDSRKVFYEGLNLASGIEVGMGGVFVGAAPYLYFIPDRNHDDVPDGKPEVELDGWAYQDTHEVLNSFIWGPDGWLYGCHGVFTHSRVGRPGTPDAERQPINAGIWRYHPVKKEFEVFAHGTSNPWGVDFDSRGQCFLTACVIPHLYHVIHGARYQRQAGTHFDPFTYDDIKTIALHRHWLGSNPHAGNNRSDNAGGGHAHSGAMIYQGASWPEKYNDQLFMNNIHGARLNQDQLTRKGSGYYGDRAPDFLFANDRSSQILYFRYGPDGQVYAIDWYDIQQCHTAKADDHDRSNGRIYRIAYKNAPQVDVNLRTWSDDKLVDALVNKNQWYVRTARRLLQERSGDASFAKVADKIRDLMTKSKSSTDQLNYLWTLSACGSITLKDIDWALASSDEYLHGFAIQFAVEDLKQSDLQQLQPKLEKLASGKNSPVDRLYLASACLKLPVQSATKILTSLVSHQEDAADHNLPLMYWYGLSRIVRENPKSAGDIAKASKIDSVAGFAVRQLSTNDNPAEMDVAMNIIKSKANNASINVLLMELSKGLATRKTPKMPSNWVEVRSELAKNKAPETIQLALSVAAKLRDESAIKELSQKVNSADAPIADRIRALATLRDIRYDKLRDVAKQALSVPEMRQAALSVLSDDLDAATSNELIETIRPWTPEERRLAIYALTRRGSTAQSLWEALQSKSIGVNEISADMVEQLGQLKDFPAFAELKEKWSASRLSVGEAEKQVAQIKAIVASQAKKNDIANGKVLFQKTCGQCHKLFGEGANIGPELTGSNRKDLDYLLSNIITPNAVMAKEYQPWIVQTDDGRVITGILKQKTAESIVLQTTTELATLYSDEIDGMKQSEQSMMPENLLTTLNAQQIGDLIAYLQGNGNQ